MQVRQRLLEHDDCGVGGRSEDPDDVGMRPYTLHHLDLPLECVPPVLPGTRFLGVLRIKIDVRPYHLHHDSLAALKDRRLPDAAVRSLANLVGDLSKSFSGCAEG
eukprot:149690-Hanusia_phi.AAC.2